MDYCDLVYKLRSHFFAKDRDVILQTGRVFEGGGIIPVGGIILWSGSVASIPTNWALCDGNNSTPNLTDRFILGAGSTYAVGATGGAATINIEHAHAGTSGAGSSHSHSSGSYTAGSPASSCYNAVLGTEISMARCAHTHDVAGTSGSESAHTHTIANDLSATQSVLNPYYSLAYIMRTA